MQRWWPPLCVVLGALLAAFCAAEERIEYNRHIRPILAENCFACHGPDSASRKADLRLDQRQAAVDYGAIAPGEPDKSGLVYRIFAEDADERMPPRSSHKSLTAEQKELLKQWVAAGAEYQPHWSLIAPARPAVPQVKDSAWVRTPIDAFVLARLEAMGLSPAPEADRRTLARRLSLDLTGLPPSPQRVEAFVEDASPDAYEKLVDELLASKAWGEHRARYWLDAARYGDTHGLHFDNFREMWTYRDWVIDAFNRNLPFDQFTVEQLAGDLLPNPSREQRVATGFNRCNITTNEGGTIPEENLVLYTRDRTETTAQVWLGLTAGCAVCHDHKFDPIPQRDFYEMAAFFNNTTQGAMDGNIKDTPPILTLPSDTDRPRWDALAGEIADAKRKVEDRRRSARDDFEKWLADDASRSWTAGVSEPSHLHAPLDEGSGEIVLYALSKTPGEHTLRAPGTWVPGHVAAKAWLVQGDNVPELSDAGDFERDQPFSVAAWIKLDRASMTGAVVARMDDANGFRGWDLWIEGGQVGMHVIHQWDGDALKVVSNKALPADRWQHVLVTYDGSGRAAGVRVYLNGKQEGTRTLTDRLKSTIRTNVPLTIGQRRRSSRLEGAAIHDLRIENRVLSADEAEKLSLGTRMAWLAAKPAASRTDAEKNELFAAWLPMTDAVFREWTARQAALEKEQADIKARSPLAYVTEERKEPPKAFVLIRGEYSKHGEEVSPNSFDCLPPMPEDLPKNRLGFARWLLRPEHPLTTRVTVNRFWQEVFGSGVVRTPGDFGMMGELPTHPELLDWLAVEFRESGWDVKKFVRLIVTSSVYRQSAAVTPEKLEKDPDNRWLSRGPRFRMDAEMIRDYAMASSGILVDKIGGPSVKPYQPPGVWEAVAMIGSDTRDYRQDHGEKLHRRSLYTFWKRAAPPASMEVFNAPSREVCTVRRERTNTPLQALVTLNDPQFVEAARHLAQRAIAEGGASQDDRLQFVAHRLLARPLEPKEMDVVRASLTSLLEHYKAHADDAKQLIAVGESKADASLDPAELAGWTMLVNQLMNLDEALNK